MRSRAHRAISLSTSPVDLAVDDRSPTTSPALGDLRFRKLVGSAAWNALPAAVRRRFSKRLEGGATAIYVGEVTDVRMSRLGFGLAQLCRLIGGPLPTSRDTALPSIVTVTEDTATGGQIWTRLYAHRHGFPQVIHSSKRFAGPTGLEEHVSCGIAMTLRVSTTSNALIFKSDRYFIALGKWRIDIPQWFAPGQLIVGHREIDPNSFAFTLDLVHPLFGHLIHQSAVFKETEA